MLPEGPPPGPGPVSRPTMMQPVQHSWGPPSAPQGPPPQQPQAGWAAPQAVRGQAAPQARKPFPIALAAGLTAVVLLAGLGLWGANQYSSTVTFEAASARVGAPEPSASPQGAEQMPGDQPQTEVTAPWAATPAPEDGAVGPLVLPSEAPTDSPGVPVLTTVPTPSQLATQPVIVPTQQRPAQKPSKTAKPVPTVTKTVKPTQKPTQKSSPKPTQKPTQKPAPTPTQQKTQQPAPTPTPTKPKPTPTKSAAQPTQKPNPHTPAQVCGSGFYVQRQGAFSGGVTYQLYNSSTAQNCVVTMKTTDVGKATPVRATLEVQGGGSQTDSGSYEYYAGPVKLQGKGKCVRFSGGAGSGSTSSAWGNCG